MLFLSHFPSHLATREKQMDLINQLESLIDQLNKSVKSLRYTGADYAEADRAYKVKLSETLLRLEAEGRPVSNLQYIARGIQDVADAKYQQIATEAIYKANLEAIQALKLQIKVLDAQIGREWSNE